MTHRLRPERSSGAAWHVRRRPAWLALVVLGHVALLLGWRLALLPWRAAQPPATPQAPLVWLNLPTMPHNMAPAAAPPQQNTVAQQPRPALPWRPPAAAPLDRPRPPAPDTRPPQETALRLLPPDAPASAASQPPPARLIDSAATRQAIRDASRNPLLSERAAGATGQGFVSGAQRMAEAASAAGHGDCLKGDHAGGGMGLLGLPVLAYAAMAGKCAR